MDDTKMVYLVVSPASWAVHEELQFALAKLLSLGTGDKWLKDTKVEVFHVTEDWEHDGFSVSATIVKKQAPIVIVPTLAKKAYEVLSTLEDLELQCLYKSEE
jgi:hypothetical protein